MHPLRCCDELRSGEETNNIACSLGISQRRAAVIALRKNSGPKDVQTSFLETVGVTEYPEGAGSTGAINVGEILVELVGMGRSEDHWGQGRPVIGDYRCLRSIDRKPMCRFSAR